MDPGGTIGSWVIESSLGEGGMGRVFRCHHVLDVTQHAAVKLLHDTEVTHRQRMIQEFKLLRQLSHPNVLKVLEAGLHDQQVYIVTELLEGETLKDRLSRGPIPEPEAVALFRSLADGVAAAHAKEIWHRDLKPANIFLTSTGPKILDFGIAVREGSTRLTRAGFYMGTPTYMAPEAFQGESGSKSDIYALGQLLWESLRGERAFTMDEGDRALIKAKVRCESLDPGEAFSPFVRSAIGAATAQEPEQRPDVKGWLSESETKSALSNMSTVLLNACPRCGNLLKPGTVCAVCETSTVPVQANKGQPEAKPAETKPAETKPADQPTELSLPGAPRSLPLRARVVAAAALGIVLALVVAGGALTLTLAALVWLLGS